CRNFILPDICKPCLFVFLRNLFYLTVVEYTLFNAGIASFQPTEQCFVFLTFRTAASVVTD
ncbi:hypothetical protein, partial [Flavonifractor plautii]|uniref:hypothetical protein n=1 Tax=Flavonifractor plautii TaxID=292800 RepID=UPI001A9AEBC9